LPGKREKGKKVTREKIVVRKKVTREKIVVRKK
jgi:hypothetical protein